MVSRTRYAITFSQFGIHLTRPIEQHVAVQETKKNCLSEKKKGLEKRIYDNLTFIQRATTKPVGQSNKSNCNYFLEVYT